MEQLFKSILLLSCVGGVLAGVLLLLKPLTKRSFSSRWQYCMWLCVLVVLLLPVRIDLPVRAVSVPYGQAVQAPSQDTRVQVDTVISPDSAVPTQIRPVTTLVASQFASDFLAVLPTLWFLGVLLSFLWNLATYLLFLHTIHKNSSSTACPELDEVRTALNIRRKIQVRTTDYTRAPLMVGLFCTTLLLPNRVN